MFKEVAQIQQLEKRRERLSLVAKERESLIGRIGTGNLQKGKEISLTIRIGNVTKSVVESAGELKGALETFEIKAEPTVLEIAKNYPDLIEQRRSQLAQLSEMAADPDTGITIDDLRVHQQEFEELVSLPHTSILFQRGLEKVGIKKDKQNLEVLEIEPENVIAVSPVNSESDSKEVEPKIYKLSNGKEIKGKLGELLILISEGTENNPKTAEEIIEKLFADLAKIDPKKALDAVSREVSEARKKFRENDEGKEIINANIDQTHLYKKGAYYIKKLEETQTPVDIDNKPENTVKSPEDIRLPEIQRVQEFMNTLDGPVRALFEKVINSEEYAHAYDVTLGFDRRRTEELRSFRGELAGYLFEILAYEYLKVQIAQKNQLVLTPKETNELYDLIRPNAAKSYSISGLQTMNNDGLSTPDGIVIEIAGNRSIIGICEYSLAGNHRNGNPKGKFTQLQPDISKDLNAISEVTKIRTFPTINQILTKYPQLKGRIRIGDKLELFTVLPEGVTASGANNINEFHVPITTKTFGGFIDAFMIDIFSKKFAAK